MIKDYFCGYSEQQVYDAAGDFPRNVHLAQYLNIPRSTFYAKLKLREDVQELIKKSRLDSAREVLKSLKKTAMSEHKSAVVAQIYYLKLMGIDDTSIDIHLEIDAENLSDAEKLSAYALKVVEKVASGEISVTLANQFIELLQKAANIYMLPKSISALEDAEKVEGVKK